jgi:hypothetical protein
VLSASVAFYNGSRAACNSGLRLLPAPGFTVHGLHLRSRTPKGFTSPRAVLINAVRTRTRVARARVTDRSTCAWALRCCTGDSNGGSILASRASVCASYRSSFRRLSPINRTLRASLQWSPHGPAHPEAGLPIANVFRSQAPNGTVVFCRTPHSSPWVSYSPSTPE